MSIDFTRLQFQLRDRYVQDIWPCVQPNDVTCRQRASNKNSYLCIPYYTQRQRKKDVVSFKTSKGATTGNPPGLPKVKISPRRHDWPVARNAASVRTNLFMTPQYMDSKREKEQPAMLVQVDSYCA
jgi:hypothetical protein